MSNYTRVLPRDLFNEAMLLKCLGKISLLIHNKEIQGLKCVHTQPEKGFIIKQDSGSGDIYVSNLFFTDESGNEVLFSHPLNARGSWPLVMTYKHETYYVFDETFKVGEFILDENIFKKDKGND